MKTNTFVPIDVIEKEISIKLFEYLKRENIIDDGMYNYIINKLIKR